MSQCSRAYKIVRPNKYRGRIEFLLLLLGSNSSFTLIDA